MASNNIKLAKLLTVSFNQDNVFFPASLRRIELFLCGNNVRLQNL